jgi:hypothetical protein
MIFPTNASSSSTGGILPQGDYFTRLRREFTGIDIDRKHIETTRRRVEEVLQKV